MAPTALPSDDYDDDGNLSLAAPDYTISSLFNSRLASARLCLPSAAAADAARIDSLSCPAL